MSVSAPGKLLLAGEYAVLDGGLAVVAAVARRAIARVTDTPGELSPFLAAAADVLRANGASGAATTMTRVVVDSSALRDERANAKLGLGSSAAATVAAIGAALTHGGRPLDRARVLRFAHAAHRAAQGGRGSGADVAVSALGGVIGFRRARGEVAATPLALPPLTWVPLWTGVAADTVPLIDAVASGHPRTAPALAAIGRAAEALAAAARAEEAIAAIDAGGDAIASLGEIAGVDLETAPVRALRAAARAAGGALKTCGAGGGDVAIAVFPPAADPTAFVEEARRAGLAALDLPFDPRGVDIDPDGDYLR